MMRNKLLFIDLNGSNTQKYNETKLCIIVQAGSNAFTVSKVFFSETICFDLLVIAIMYTKHTICEIGTVTRM